MQRQLRLWNLGLLVSGMTVFALAAPPNSAPQATQFKPEVVQGLKPANAQAVIQSVSPPPVPANQRLPAPATGIAVKDTPSLPRINPNAVKPGTLPPLGNRDNTIQIIKEIPRQPGPEGTPPPRPVDRAPERFQSLKPGLVAPIAASDRPSDLGKASPPVTAKRPELGQAVDPKATLGRARDAALIQNELNALDGLDAGDLNLDLNDAGGPAIAGGPDASLNQLRDLQPGGGPGGLGSAESFNEYLGDPNHGPNQPGQKGPGGAVSAPNPNSFGVDGLSIVSDGASKPGPGASGGAVGGAGGAGSAGGAAAGSVQRTEPNRSTPGTTQATDPATGSTTTKSRSADGSTIVTMTFPGEQESEGSVQTVRYDPQGNPVGVQNDSSAGGVQTRETYVPYGNGTWLHTSSSSEDGGLTWTGQGPETTYRTPFIAGPRQGGASNVDPDSPQGGGGAVGLGEKRKDPKAVEARDRGVGPGVRPDENQTVGGAPRLNVDLGGTVVNPPPGEQQGGGPAHQGFNPSSTMDDDLGPRAP